MNVRMLQRAFLTISTLFLLLASGCTGVPGRLRTESQTVELGGAQSVRVRIEMGAGELEVEGGSSALMDADFRFNVARWQPEMSYEVSQGRGELIIQQPRAESIRWLNHYRYEWDVRLREDTPIDLSVAMGAGESRLNVSSLSLRSLEVDVGAGECVVDLAGEWQDDLEVSVEGGVGQVTVLLPEAVGARVEVAGGLGEINASGLEIDGDAYVNDAYGESAVTVHVNIQGGIGEVNLDVVG